LTPGGAAPHPPAPPVDLTGPSRRHARRRGLLHALCLALARHRPLIECALSLARPHEGRGRVPRLAAVFAFVGQLADDSSPDRGGGLDWLRRLTDEEDAPSVLLAALLLALGERAQLDFTRELPFVRVELQPADVARLPPHALVLQAGPRIFLALACRHRRSPLGFIPRDARLGLARRRRLRVGILAPEAPSLAEPARL
jgi:hypothetical protein